MEMQDVFILCWQVQAVTYLLTDASFYIHICANRCKLLDISRQAQVFSYLLTSSSICAQENTLFMTVENQTNAGSYSETYSWCTTREYWIIYRGPGFIEVAWFGSSSTPPVSKLEPATNRKNEKERQDLTGEEGPGMGEEPNHTKARKPGPL